MTTIQLCDEPTTLTLREVAEQLANCGAIQLVDDEIIGDVRLEFEADLEVEIDKVVDGDPRCREYNERSETWTLGDIRCYFTMADFYAWGKDENGEYCLYCFGC